MFWLLPAAVRPLRKTFAGEETYQTGTRPWDELPRTSSSSHSIPWPGNTAAAQRRAGDWKEGGLGYPGSEIFPSDVASRQGWQRPTSVLGMSVGHSFARKASSTPVQTGGSKRRRAGSNGPQCPGEISSINHAIDWLAAGCDAPPCAASTSDRRKPWDIWLTINELIWLWDTLVVKCLCFSGASSLLPSNNHRCRKPQNETLSCAFSQGKKVYFFAFVSKPNFRIWLSASSPRWTRLSLTHRFSAIFLTQTLLSIFLSTSRIWFLFVFLLWCFLGRSSGKEHCLSDWYRPWTKMQHPQAVKNILMFFNNNSFCFF